MARFRVFIKPSAAKELETIDGKKDRQRVARRIAGLAHDPRPRGIEKLSGREWYRLRQGKHRIVYSIDDARASVLVVKVGHRRDVYRDLP